MEFTYLAYQHLIELLKKNEYQIINYEEYNNYDKTAILRHDIDMNITKALEMAKVEAELGVKSTYFVLLTSDFYNPFSKKNQAMLQEIRELGHTIGLHFDEVRYEGSETRVEQIEKEIGLLEQCLECEVTTVSMHRPSQETLDANLVIRQGKVINSYGTEFFHDFKYVSDSRRRWRENVYSIVESNEFTRLHILTHPIWYNQVEIKMRDSLKEFVFSATDERYNTLTENIRDLQEVFVWDKKLR